MNRKKEREENVEIFIFSRVLMVVPRRAREVVCLNAQDLEGGGFKRLGGWQCPRSRPSRVANAGVDVKQFQQTSP